MCALALLAANDSEVVRTKSGPLAGFRMASGVRAFHGVPFAEPPVGERRWRAPEPAKPWKEVREAKAFGPRCVQHPIFGDMNFRSNGMSEDCLYLNVWAPASGQKLPVLVYFYGGGFMAGDGSEPRYDGESMAKRGIVAVTVNYRLGVYGFLAHPELTKESPHKASGNYGLLDQNQALRWVKDNIAAFGGDPARVTIAGESAGSSSVSAQMVSPLSKGLFAAAIGESGSMVANPLPPREHAEKQGEEFAASAGAKTLAELRALSTEKMQEVAKPRMRFSSTVDGYFFPEQPKALFAAGRQSQVPLLAGWNSEEGSGRSLFAGEPVTAENYRKALAKAFGAEADKALALYPPVDDADGLLAVATELASDRFTGFSTWKWIDLAMKHGGGKPVYRYYYTRPRPPMRPEMGKDAAPGLAGGVVRTATPPPPARGAVHSAEIEYAMGNLASNKVFAWTAEDYKVSETMQAYFENFVKTHNPNGKGLPEWPALSEGKVMTIDVTSKAVPEPHRARYEWLDKMGPPPR